jgi:vacuolar-type H+-ATPase subunit H
MEDTCFLLQVNQAKETLVEAERKSNAMIADAEAKSTQILAEAIERARLSGILCNNN